MPISYLLYLNGCMDLADFCIEVFLTHLTLCFKEITASPKITVLRLGHSMQNVEQVCYKE